MKASGGMSDKHLKFVDHFSCVDKWQANGSLTASPKGEHGNYSYDDCIEVFSKKGFAMKQPSDSNHICRIKRMSREECNSGYHVCDIALCIDIL